MTATVPTTNQASGSVQLTHYLEKIYEQHPHLRYPETEEYLQWPIYVLNQTEELPEIWERLAEALRVPYLHSVSQLNSVNAALNSTSHNALTSGILWVKRQREFTPQVKTLGVTYHPLLASNTVYLITPSEWHELFIRMFPIQKREQDDAARMVTFTADIDKKDYARELNSAQQRAVLLVERGIGSGQPQHTPMQAEAQNGFDVNFMQSNHIIPFRVDRTHGVLSVYMTNVDDSELIGRLTAMTRMKIKPYLMEPDDEEMYWELKDLARRAEEAEAQRNRAALLNDLLD